MTSTAPLARSLQRSTRSLSRWRPARAVRPCLATTTRPAMSRCAVTVFRPARTFATSRVARMADVDESFDPASVERESDQVDVCIIGGGMYSRPPRRHVPS